MSSVKRPDDGVPRQDRVAFATTGSSQSPVGARTPHSAEDALSAEELVRRHYATVYNLALRTLGRRNDAEDIAQQTFLRALPHVAQLRSAEVAGWLYRVAANLCVDQIRRRSRHVDVESAEPLTDELISEDPLGDPEVAAELRETRLTVWRATLALPPQQRLALALREWQGMSYADIATAMSTTTSAVEALLFRARQGFRVSYRQLIDQPGGSDTGCTWYLERLSASLDGELSAEDQRLVDAHLARCPRCEFVAHELRASNGLYALAPLIAPPVQAKAALLAALTGAVVAGGEAIGTGAVAVIGSATMGSLGGASASTGVGGIAAVLGSAKSGFIAAVLASTVAATAPTVIDGRVTPLDIQAEITTRVDEIRTIVHALTAAELAVGNEVAAQPPLEARVAESAVAPAQVEQQEPTVGAPGALRQYDQGQSRQGQTGQDQTGQDQTDQDQTDQDQPAQGRQTGQTGLDQAPAMQAHGQPDQPGLDEQQPEQTPAQLSQHGQVQLDGPSPSAPVRASVDQHGQGPDQQPLSNEAAGDERQPEVDTDSTRRTADEHVPDPEPPAFQPMQHSQQSGQQTPGQPVDEQDPPAQGPADHQQLLAQPFAQLEHQQTRETTSPEQAQPGTQQLGPATDVPRQRPEVQDGVQQAAPAQPPPVTGHNEVNEAGQRDASNGSPTNHLPQVDRAGSVDTSNRSSAGMLRGGVDAEARDGDRAGTRVSPPRLTQSKPQASANDGARMQPAANQDGKAEPSADQRSNSAPSTSDTRRASGSGEQGVSNQSHPGTNDAPQGNN